MEYKQHQQFLVICNGDSDTQTRRVLATRRVFTSFEEATAFASEKSSAHREPEVVECYFPVPDTLYRQDWQPVIGEASREVPQ
jgi:hypothetical protein